MNDITDELYKFLKAGDTTENLDKIKTLFQLSDISKSAGLGRLTIDTKSLREEDGFKLNILSYACRNLNLRGLWMITQVIAEYMRIQHIKGSIINIFRAF